MPLMRRDVVRLPDPATSLEYMRIRLFVDLGLELFKQWKLDSLWDVQYLSISVLNAGDDRVLSSCYLS